MWPQICSKSTGRLFQPAVVLRKREFHMSVPSDQIAGPLRKHEHLVGASQRVVDAAVIVFSQLLAIRIYGDTWRPGTTSSTILGILIFMLAGEFGGLYRPWRTESLAREARELLVSGLAVPIGLTFFAFVTKTATDHSRGVWLLWFVLAPAMLTLVRLVIRNTMRYFRSRGMNQRRVVIFGATREAEKLAAVLEESPWLGLDLLGIYDDRETDRRRPIGRFEKKLLGDFDALVRDARQGTIDIIYVALPMGAQQRNENLFRALADTTVRVFMVAGLHTYNLARARWSNVGGLPVVSIHDSALDGAGALLKRIEDLMVGSLILMVTLLPMLAIALAIKLTSRGPVFFRQWRYGISGKPIRVLKFRTMRTSDDGPVVKQATKDDPRVTPLGRFLRRSSMDELPQFLQVITGELSIVGPRPHAVAHNELYRTQIDGYMLRHMVKPGITGWAQVNGWRGETATLDKMEGRIRHDLEYVRNWSLLWDLEIIFRTVFGSKKSQNAY
jgi:putative colanic acid biosynthesis UDP-glucose lipid carrier transferase